MATAIQVTLCIIFNVCIFGILYPFTGVSALVVEIEIPSNAPEGFKITKVGCTGKDIIFDVPGNEVQLFSITETGELVLKQTVNNYENQQLTVYITRLTSTAGCVQCTDIPQISSLLVSVKPPSHFISFPEDKRELRGYLDLTGSSQVQGKDIDILFRTFDFLSPTYSLIGSMKAADLFEFRKDTTGNLHLHMSISNVPACRIYRLICKMVTADNRVLFTDLRVEMINEHNMMSAVNHDNYGAREPSVAITPNHDLQTQGHDLTVIFDQYKTMTGELTARRTNFHHRHRRQVQTAAVTKTISEGTTGILYNFTRQGTGTTFQLKQAVPDMVTVNQNGQVFLKPGQVLDFDNGPQSIQVEVFETTGNSGTAEYEHTLTLTIENVNDEIPNFTNIPTPMLATVDAWAPVGTTFYTLTALDQDPGSVLGFYMEGTSTKFEVVELTGEIKTKATLTQNYDEDITVYCKDTSAPTEQISSTQKVSITTKYRPPQFYLSEYFGHIPENARTGQTFSLQNSDSNNVDLRTVNFQNGATSYSIINPRTLGPSAQFDITQDGKLLTLQEYDHEKTPQYNLLLQARDSASQLTSTVSRGHSGQSVRTLASNFRLKIRDIKFDIPYPW
ncbi:neural-cadherin-like [Pecten maximus]|uniref:neural-cadherin-like n=1 Tax=Pecten maximus TaxID=6579 RepID=UPI001458AC5D|nr:neural-cadherin-like [Pecten maximus]